MRDYDGLGYRVPLLVVSPYAKEGYVSHVDYEHGSLLRFVEDRFGLATLSAADARATSPEADCFDFLQAPRKFVPIQTTMTERDFEKQPLDRRIPDRESTQKVHFPAGRNKGSSQVGRLRFATKGRRQRFITTKIF